MLFAVALPLAHRPRLLRGGLLALIALAFVVAPVAAEAETSQARKVKVMTRNLYLGADLTAGVQARISRGWLCGRPHPEPGDPNNFPSGPRASPPRSSAEARPRRPAGGRAVAYGAVHREPAPAEGDAVRYDYLKSLLAELNKGKKLYRTVIAEPEFDFEVYANTDGDQSTAAAGCPLGSEINGRLTMRDVILARVGSVKTSKPKAGQFHTLLRVKPGGVTVNVTRGWTRVDAKVGKRSFRFVNTHLEAFDNGEQPHQQGHGRHQRPDPRGAGQGAVRQGRPGDRQAPGDPGRRPELGQEDRGEAGRRARLQRAARRRLRRAGHEQPARLLPRTRTCSRATAAATSPTSTTRSTT